MQSITTWITRLAKALPSSRQKTRAESPIYHAPTRDYTHERETERSDHLGADDQAWEADRRQRDQTARAATTGPTNKTQADSGAP